MASAALTTPLRDTLRAGLSVVSELWNYKARDWITNVHVADINNDGDLEILVCSRDGRVRILNKDGNIIWERVIGQKAWIGAIAGIPFSPNYDDYPNEQYIPGKTRMPPVRVIAGTRDGKVYALDQHGRTIGKDGTIYAIDENGQALVKDAEAAACWLDTQSVIRQIFVDEGCAPDVIIGSQDGYAYALNYTTGKLHWQFPANGWVRAVFSGDINHDGKPEVLIGTNEKSLYVLTHTGNLLTEIRVQHPIRALYAADVDNDGETEILIATDGKDLLALTPTFQEKWRRTFDNRINALHLADIDADGKSEIIAGSEDKHFYILDRQGKTLWRHALGSRVFSVYATDINNDGITEILVGAEDSRIHVYQVQLVKDLEKRILKHYQTLGSATPEIEASLPADELSLLHDILGKEGKQRAAHKNVTLESAELLIAGKHYLQALSELLRLEQRKVQLLWSKEKVGLIRSLCLGHLSDGKRNIVVGTNEGNIQAFNRKGRLIGSVSIGQRVLDMHMGFIEHGKPETILVYSSDHQLYSVSGITRREQQHVPRDYETACIFVSGGNKERPSELFIGADKEINIYSNGLHASPSVIPLTEGVRLIHAHTRTEEDTPEIIAGSTNRWIHAFSNRGTDLWKYEVWDRIQAIETNDIDGDGEIEVIAGSEDRNIHVLDSKGRLRWRYVLPHSILALQTIDVDKDGKGEILAGCADGYVYILSGEGDILWKYQANDRIRALKALDLDDDGNIEIVVGSEDKLEVLRVVNQRQVRELLRQCLSALQKEASPEEVYTRLLHSPDPALKAFAITRIARQADLSPDIFDILEAYCKDGFIEVRQALLSAIITCYPLSPQRASLLLNQLYSDANQEVRLAFLACLPALMQSDWKQGMVYLERFLGNDDRVLRRAVVRQLDHFINHSQTHASDKALFDLLFRAAQDKDFEWIRQEAARAMAHLLDRYNGRLIFYMHLFIVKNLPLDVLQLIGLYTTRSLTRTFIEATLPLLTDIQKSELHAHLQRIVDVLKDMTSLEFGKDAWKIYEEFYRLFTFGTIEDLASYRCSFNANDFGQENDLAAIVLQVLQKLRSITRYINIYTRRTSINDRLTNLLDALRAIDEVTLFLEHTYTGFLLGQPIIQLPDHRLFELLLQQWKTLVNTQLNELRGRASFNIELQTKSVRYEEQIGIWLKISNTGRGSADTITLSLLDNPDCEVVGSQAVKMDSLLAEETRQIEFTIKPHTAYLDLQVAVVYNDAEQEMKEDTFTAQLKIEDVAFTQEFRYIPNPYSTGTPVQHNHMFYGRDEAVTSLRDNLTRSAAQTVLLLYGQRRSGKTTLLLHLVRTSVLEEHIPVLIDMQRESYNISASRFLHNMGFIIAQAMRKKGYTISLPELHVFDSDPTFTFGIFLDAVEELLKDQKLIILIDEFEVLEEQIKRGKIEPEFLDYMRSMMQHHHNINFLLSGTHQIEDLTVANWSVFFNIARHYRLSRLSPQGAEDLITKPVEGYLEYGPYTVEKIRQLTADQPYLIHLLCRSLVDHCNERRKTYVTINDVNLVLREVMQTCTAHFNWLWKQLTQQEQHLLAVIAELAKTEERFLTFAEIEDLYRYYTLPYSREHMQIYCKMLGEADIIDIGPGTLPTTSFLDRHVKIPAGLMRLWLHQEKPLKLILDKKVALS